MIDIIIIGKRIVFLKRSCPTFFTLIISGTPSPTFLSSPPLGQIFSNFSSFSEKKIYLLFLGRYSEIEVLDPATEERRLKKKRKR